MTDTHMYTHINDCRGWVLGVLGRQSPDKGIPEDRETQTNEHKEFVGYTVFVQNAHLKP